MKSKMVKVALGAALLFLLSGASFAQAPWWGYQNHNGWGYQGDRDRREYNNGFRDGQNDREHGRSWHPRHSEQDYMNGYRAGYGRNGGWQGRRDDHDRDDDRYRGGNNPYGGPYRNPNGTYGNYPYGRGGSNIQSVAYNNGFQEGLRYGAADRNNGHSNRPTYSSTYQNGSSGYSSAMGDKMTYKRAFQQGYQAGYQRGYNGR
jgi:hypothetical protein